MVGFVASAMLVLAVGTGAHAADKLRAGKAVATSFPMAILDLGAEEGVFARYGIELEITAFTGDARLQQAFAAASTDVGLGSGPAMAFLVKGAPAIGVAAFAGPPRTISVAVIPESPIKKPADLKGKLLAISTTGSLTEWLAKRLAIQEGWGPDGVRVTALGAGSAMNGALFTRQIDAMMTGTENAFILLDKGQARIVTGMESYAPDFITHVVFATTALTQTNPDLVRRFLKGFFASMRFAKTEKARTIEVLSPLLNESPAVLDQIYAHELPMLIEDGQFDAKAVAVLKDSFVEMGTLDRKPVDDEILTRRFLPVTPD
jgi:ABC-type nitrate/sulfonate/bicarbonate transport system substrate-binding protein